MTPPPSNTLTEVAPPEDDGEVEPLEPSTLSLRVDERGRVFARRSEGEEVQVIARRAFPWTMADAFISLRTTKGRELAMLETLDVVPDAARETIRTALNVATFIPRITAVRRVSLEHGFQSWDVTTEAGDTNLRVQEREDVRFFSDARLGIKDANGNVYEIADVHALDAHSRRELSKIM